MPSVTTSTLCCLLPFRLAPKNAEPLVPEPIEKQLQVAEPFRAREVQTMRAAPSLAHKPRLLQDPKVLRDRRPRHVEMRRDLPRGQLAAPDELEDPPPAGLSDRLQGCFHRRQLSRYLRKCQLTLNSSSKASTRVRQRCPEASLTGRSMG